MSYFDHVSCHSCKARINPESLASVPGQGMSCPQCKAPLSLTDLFGLKDAFQQEEDDTMEMDDLVPGPSKPRRPQPQRHQEQPRRAAPRSSNAMVPRGTNEGSGDAPSALELMRQMKKKR